MCPNFQLRAIPFSLQHFSSSSSREACEIYKFYREDGFLCPPTFEKFWVAFLLGCNVGAMLRDVALFVVATADWKLFSSGPFSCYLYN